MTTITIWLLISIGYGLGYNGKTSTLVVARFADADECQRVATVLRNNKADNLMCVQAKVLKD